MTTSPTSATEDSTGAGAVASQLPSWRRSLAARHVSPRTIAIYTTSAEPLAAFLAISGLPTAVGRIRREHVEAFVEDLLRTHKPATAHNRYCGCRAFFAWCVRDGEVKASPMERMRPPKLVEEPPAVLREGDLRRLLDTTDRDKTFSGVRDATPTPQHAPDRESGDRPHGGGRLAQPRDGRVLRQEHARRAGPQSAAVALARRSPFGPDEVSRTRAPRSDYPPDIVRDAREKDPSGSQARPDLWTTRRARACCPPRGWTPGSVRR